MRASLLFAASISASVLLVRSARADIAPPDGFVETCTVDQQCPGAGTTCSVTQGQVDTTCDAAARQQGLVQKCTTFGATAATAVYCPPSTTSPDASTTDGGASTGGGSSGGCSFGDGASCSRGGVALLVAACAIASRRRRRSATMRG